MPNPDVRVRLSAEGVQEVVDALKRIQSEATKTSAATSKAAASGKAGFDGFRKALSGVGDLLSAFGITVSVGAMIDLARQAVDAADAITKLRERLGGTLQDLSALSVGARLNRSSLEDLQAGMGTLARRVAELRLGDPAAAQWFSRLGLSAKSFKGLALPEQLELVARGLQKLATDGTRAAATQYVLGKSALSLIPVLNQLGTTGLKGLRDQARSLGLLIDPRAVEQAQRLGDSMGVLNEQVHAVAMTFVSGFATATIGAFEDYERNLGTAISATEGFGRVVGQIPRTIYGLLKVILAPIAALFARLTVDAMAVWDAASLAMRGHFGEALARGKLLEQQRKAINDRARKDIEDGWKLATTISGRGEGGPSAPGGGELTLEEGFQRRAEAMKAALENEKKLHDAQLALRERNETSSYERSLTTIRDHYAARRRAISEALTWEIAALVQQRALSALNPDREAGLREQRNIDVQIQARKIQAHVQLADLADKEIADTRRAGDTKLSYERKILDAEGDRFASSLRGLEEEKRLYAENLRLQGLSTAEISRRVGEFERAMQAAANFEEARNEADRVMARFTSERSRIQSDIDAGVLTQIQGENKILALERQRLPGLLEMAEALERAAEATGDPDRIAQAKQFTDGLRNMGRAASVAEQSMQHLKAGFEDALKDGLIEFFTTGVNQAQTFGQAMQSLAASVVSALQRMAAEALALQILEGLKFLGFSGGGQVKKSNPRASGGLMSGPGTGTSDSIPAWVSHGEFIMPAARVAAPGMLQHLEGIRAGMQPIHIQSFRPGLRFADGGLVAGAAAGASRVDGTINVSVDPGLIIQTMETPEGQRVQLKNLGRNRRAISRLLG